MKKRKGTDASESVVDFTPVGNSAIRSPDSPLVASSRPNPTIIAKILLGSPGSDLKADADNIIDVVKAPVRRSFEEFLLNDARVPVGRGVYEPYSFQGREPLLAVVRVIDRVLGGAPVSDPARFKMQATNAPGQEIGAPHADGNENGGSPRAARTPTTSEAQGRRQLSCAHDANHAAGARSRGQTHSQRESVHHQNPTAPLPDAEISLAGGAQFGKTLLELNLAAYLTGQQFRNFGLYLPDDDLVEGIVDSKFRPDVVDQIDWFAKMTQVGKALNRSGRAVNRKGAFLVTDGRRKATGVVRGLGKVPTAFSMDVAAMDELDDLQPRRMKFVRGRLAASDLRFILKLGTQRIHGRGMNQAWKDGSQGVFHFVCTECGRVHCAEEEFPQIVRLRPVGRVPLPGAGLGNAGSGDHETNAGSGDPAYNVVGDEVRSLQSKFQCSQSLVTNTGGTPRSKTRMGTADEVSTTARGEHAPSRVPDRALAVGTNARHRALSPGTRAGARLGAVDGASTAAREARALPKLTWSGDFKVDGNDVAFAHEPGNEYYLGCVDCGAELDRSRPIEEHRRPELIRQRKWSFRISQLGIAAIDLSQIVGRFQGAVADPEEMAVFRCDVLALPQSTSQSLTPAILDRARLVEPYDLGPMPRAGEGRVAFGGLDMGDRCWLFAREIAATCNRLLSAQKIPAGDVVAQAVAQFHQLGLTALFIDERPLVNEARAIVLALNGLQSLNRWPQNVNPGTPWIELSGGLAWDARQGQGRWLNLKCALVRFTKSKLGSGIEHTMVFFEEGGQTKFVPCIACNRFETIDRVVREFLTPSEGVVDLAAPGGHHFSTTAPTGSGGIRQVPAMLLPGRMPGQSPPILDLVDPHFITGSERVKEPDGSLGDYVDGCENHLLLANAYSALAATVCAGKREEPNLFMPLFGPRPSIAEVVRLSRPERGLDG